MMSAQAPAMQNPLVAGKLGQSRRFLLLDANAINPFSATTQADDDTTSYLHPLLNLVPLPLKKNVPVFGVHQFRAQYLVRNPPT